MTTVEYNNKKYEINENETVLNSLLRNDILIPYSCQNGICQTCMMKITEGIIPRDSQKGLPEAYKEENHFLPCICKPTEDIKIESGTLNSKTYDAKVISIHKEKDDILILKLKCLENFEYKPGQFVNIINSENTSRCYSLASHPKLTSELEFHIKKRPHGMMTNWIFNELKIHHKIKISGPNGLCFYTNNCNHKPLLLACVGTGLAPMIGILKDALLKKHNGNIHLIHGSYKSSGIYYKNEIIEIQKNNSNVFYYACSLIKDSEEEDVQEKTIQNIIENQFSDLSNWEVFLCGNDEFVKDQEQQCFLQGAELNSIHADTFT